MPTLARLLLLIALCAQGAAFAWSMGGHRVTGVIAARELAARAPQTIAAIETLMQAHPAAAAIALRLDETGDDPRARAERLFAEMAQWPDEVRSGPLRQYHRADWHTVEWPFVLPGFTPPAPAVPPAENLPWALARNLRIAADPAAAASERAVALCWLFHLVGDLHQPLHTLSLYSADFPAGDRYGSRFFVRPRAGDDAASLHYFWDSSVIRSQKMPDVLQAAGLLALAHPRSALAELTQRPFAGAATLDRWIEEESRPLGIAVAYRDGGLAGAAERRGAPALPPDYVATAQALGARRTALAAYRLADLLQAILP